MPSIKTFYDCEWKEAAGGRWLQSHTRLEATKSCKDRRDIKCAKGHLLKLQANPDSLQHHATCVLCWLAWGAAYHIERDEISFAVRHIEGKIRIQDGTSSIRRRTSCILQSSNSHVPGLLIVFLSGTSVHASY